MKRLLRLTLFLAVCMLLVVSVGPALAQVAPAITVAPIWTPVTQLTSYDGDGNPAFPSDDNDGCYEPGAAGCDLGANTTFDDDVRFASAEIWVTSSVPFWAMQMTCTVNPTLLEKYTFDYDGTLTPDDWTDGNPMVWIGNPWFENSPGPAFIQQAPDEFNAAGAMTFTISRVGNGSMPLGGSGSNQTLLVAKLNYRVKTQLPAFTTGTSTLTCTSAFLDRDGKPVVTPVYKAPPPLTIRNGYVISGNVQYQSRTAHSSIGVNCISFSDSNPSSQEHKTVAAANGNFTVVTRDQGWYECVFFGNISDTVPAYNVEESDLYLRTKAGVQLRDINAYTMLPVVIPSGNTARYNPELGPDCDWHDGIQPCGDERIEQADLNIITDPNNWNKTGKKWDSGDVNGDGKTDKADLAILAGNYDLWEDNWVEHALFSLPRDAALFQNSKIWLGNRNSGVVKALIPPVAKTRDLWATLSPTGAQIAFIRSEVVANQPDRYALWVVNADGKTNLKRLTPPNWTYAGKPFDAFAPSWSLDGTKIAFVCSWWDASLNTGIAQDEGRVCMADTAGNLQVFANTTSHIFPPTWEWQSIVYGGQVNDSECADTICWLDITNSNHSRFDTVNNSFIVNPGDKADMPRMSDGRMVIRYTDGAGNRTLRFVEISYINCVPDVPCDPIPNFTPFTINRTPNTALYTEVRFLNEHDNSDPGDDTYDPVSTKVEFLELSPDHQGVGILFYEEGGHDYFWLGGMNNPDYHWGWDDPDNDDGEYPYWNNPDWNRRHVLGQFGNLDMTNPLYYGLRNSVDWTY